MSTKETKADLRPPTQGDRYVLVVITAAKRSDGTGQRMDVVEFRNKAAANKALDLLAKYPQFDAVLVDDSR
jgi:hypothetical protein